MRTLSFVGLIFSILVPVGTACGNGTGAVISSADGGGPGMPLFPTPVDCASGPNFTGCVCKAGETLPCYTGPAATRGVGPCKDGVQTCVAMGGDVATYAFGECAGEVLPSSTNACTQDAGTCPATPAHCLTGYVFDVASCQCVVAIDGGTGAACGGFAGTACTVGFYCDNYPVNDPCGGGDSTGTCTAQSTIGCVPDGTPAVCGCDGKPYTNACGAHAAGVAVRKTGGC